MVDISIISYSKDNAEDVCSIHNSAFKSYIDEFGMLYGYRNLIPDDISSWLKNHESNIWLAYIDNEPVGYIHCYLVKEKKDNEILVFWFAETVEGRGQSRIAVIPLFRRKGIARALVRHAIEYYQKKDAEIAVAVAYNDNELASQFFNTLGFEHKRYHYYKKYSKTEPFEMDAVLARVDLTQSIPKIILNPEVNVRIFTEHDLPAIKEISLNAKHIVWEKYSSIDNFIKWWYQEGRGEVTLVAEFEGKIVGFMEYTSAGAIGIAGVLPSHRKKGIGSTLFYYLLKSMKEKGLPKGLADSGYVPWTEDARRMYNRFNFDCSRDLWVWIKNV